MQLSLLHKNALVGGASAGIGRAAAIELAALGANVTLLARTENSLLDAVSLLDTSQGQQHHYIVADFTDPDTLLQKVRHLLEKRPVHILVNNTGGPPGGAITEADPAAFLSAYNNHLICNQLLAQAVLPGMKTAGYGRIINIISTSVKEPLENLGVSNTTRWAVASWAKTWAGEVGPFGITVNNVLPGFTRTGRLEELLKNGRQPAATAANKSKRNSKETCRSAVLPNRKRSQQPWLFWPARQPRISVALTCRLTGGAQKAYSTGGFSRRKGWAYA